MPGRAIATTITCPECGRTYTCDPDGACWCRDVTIRLPVPESPDAQCLCPCKLERLADQAKRAQP